MRRQSRTQEGGTCTGPVTGHRKRGNTAPNALKTGWNGHSFVTYLTEQHLDAVTAAAAAVAPLSAAVTANENKGRER